jgi:heme exporter protein B
LIGSLIARDLRRGAGGATWLPIAFFMLVATLVPFAVGPDARLLDRIGPGLLWIAGLTAALLPIERLVEPDRLNGVIDQLKLHGLAEESIATAKIIAHWLAFTPLLLVASVPAGVLLGMDMASVGRWALTFAIASPALAGLAVGIAALTSGLARASALAGLLLLPLAIPLLIFGAAASGGGRPGALMLEAAISLLITAGAPFVAGAAIRAART